ncbi:hypothetical protein BJ878DRAFT_253706 [Calycina marina]|uniref:Zn(2)-C6 fungal-type domain-containing protein n=1 Tax=Calycina marina TaxID=1763456 RepID=A0A9P7YW03_9HELO|nr:hypothetical protein BJ878DRAFT_253706 [Calycina marina]
MFLITPKSKHKSKPDDAQINRPVAKIRGPARVRAACDRCRMKKVKCDGDTPCLRCMQDSVVCTANKKVPTDAKAASTEYIRSMEAQQGRLIKALKDINQHIQQPVGREGIKEILETVRDCGFEFEGMVDHARYGKQTMSTSAIEPPVEHHFGTNHIKKRKREFEMPTGTTMDGDLSLHDGTPPNIQSNGAMQNVSYSMSPGVNSIPKHFGNNHWDLNAPQNAVSGSLNQYSNHQAQLPMKVGNALLDQQQCGATVQNAQDLLESMLGSSWQPTNNLISNGDANLPAQYQGPPLGQGVLGASLTTSNIPCWDSTIWWDPSPLFGTSFGAAQYHTDAR